MKYWLMKSEPEVFSIDALAKAPKKVTAWDGVRNYQARNFMRDEMKKGDLVFFYHSNCDEPGIYGIAKVAKEAYPDETAFQRGHDHYDPKSKRDAPQWYVVDVSFVRKFAQPVTLETLKRHHDQLSQMLILRRGNRLSVTPVSEDEWNFVLSLA